MMKHSTEDDFTVMEVFESGVTVLFDPRRAFILSIALPIPTTQNGLVPCHRSRMVFAMLVPQANRGLPIR